MISIALFTGAIFVYASIVVNRCQAFLRLFLYLLCTSPLEMQFCVGKCTFEILQLSYARSSEIIS